MIAHGSWDAAVKRLREQTGCIAEVTARKGKRGCGIVIVRKNGITMVMNGYLSDRRIAGAVIDAIREGLLKSENKLRIGESHETYTNAG